MRNYTAKDVDEYIASSEPEAQQTLKELRKIVKSTIPGADEKISWGVPFYRYNGLLAGYSAFKNHASFGLVFALDSSDREKLEKMGYATGKKTIQIRFDQEVPVTEIKKILLTRAKMNEEKKYVKY